MILLNNNHYQAAAYFLFPKTDFTLQQIKSFEKSRAIVGKLTSAGLKLGLLKFREWSLHFISASSFHLITF